MGVDCKELKALKKKLENEVNAMDLFIQDCAKELAARLIAKAIRNTPTGQKPEFKDSKGEKLPKSAKVKGTSGKSKSFLTREGAILEQYWGGYAGGTLKRGWVSKTKEEAESGSGSPTAADAKAFVETLDITYSNGMYTIEVTNPLPYASYVEFGHPQTPGRYVPAIGKRLIDSWVDGKFFLTRSELELKREAPRIIEAKIAKELGEYFK